MPTLVLGPRQTGDNQHLWRAASRLGWRVERLATWRIPDDLRGCDEPVLYVEALFAPTLAEALGVRLVEPPDDWLPSLPAEFRGRAVNLTTAGGARQNPAPMFVKPPNDKSFPAGVCCGPELPTFVADDAPRSRSRGRRVGEGIPVLRTRPGVADVFGVSPGRRVAEGGRVCE